MERAWQLNALVHKYRDYVVFMFAVKAIFKSFLYILAIIGLAFLTILVLLPNDEWQSILANMFRIDSTQQAPFFDEVTFRMITVGMPIEKVESILGPPLSIVVNSTCRGENVRYSLQDSGFQITRALDQCTRSTSDIYYSYTYQGDTESYFRIRGVSFSRGLASKIIREFSDD